MTDQIEPNNSFYVNAVAYFLSRFGNPTTKYSLPPKELNTASWKDAFTMFYKQLGNGRKKNTFINTMSLARDNFDSYFPETGRIGWRDSSTRLPNPLTGVALEVFEMFKASSRQQVWSVVRKLINVPKGHSITGTRTRCSGELTGRVRAAPTPTKDAFGHRTIPTVNMTLTIHGKNPININLNELFNQLSKQ